MTGGGIIRNVIQLTRRTRFLALAGVRVPPTCFVGAGVKLRRNFVRRSHGELTLGDHCEILDGTIIETWGGSIRLGDNVFVGPYTVIYGHGGVVIGSGTLVSMHCRILSSNHTIPPVGVAIRSQPDVLLPTRIGADVWLGAGATVLGGVTIGDGCVVGAGAVVTTDLPPYSIAVGAPARVVRSRATEAKS